MKCPLHFLICNAGIMTTSYRTTKQGFESTFGTNHLGHFVLVNSLLDTLKASAPSRVVVVSSGLHHKGNTDWNLNEKKFSTMLAYGQSKLANVYFAKELDRQLEEEAKAKGWKERVTVYSLHPGVIHTELGRDYGFLYSIYSFFGRPWLKSSAQGAATTLYCALEPSLQSKGGGYYQDCAFKHPSRLAQDGNVAKQLWLESQQMTAEFFLPRAKL